MFTTMVLANSSVMSHNDDFLFVVGTIQIYFLTI